MTLCSTRRNGKHDRSGRVQRDSFSLGRGGWPWDFCHLTGLERWSCLGFRSVFLQDHNQNRPIGMGLRFLIFRGAREVCFRDTRQCLFFAMVLIISVLVFLFPCARAIIAIRWAGFGQHCVFSDRLYFRVCMVV